MCSNDAKVHFVLTLLANQSRVFFLLTLKSTYTESFGMRKNKDMKRTDCLLFIMKPKEFKGIGSKGKQNKKGHRFK